MYKKLILLSTAIIVMALPAIGDDCLDWFKGTGIKPAGLLKNSYGKDYALKILNAHEQDPLQPKEEFAMDNANNKKQKLLRRIHFRILQRSFKEIRARQTKGVSVKKYIYIPLLVMTLCGIAFASVKHFWRGETMSLKQAEKRWGSESFDAQKFKSSATNDRSKMVVSIIKTKALVGKNRLEIREMLGSQDGYYFTDMYPAYIVFEDPKSNGETWQIVGLLDKDYKVKEVIIHKNCCDK